MTEANPYRPPGEPQGEFAASAAAVPANQRSLLGAILLGSLGYVGPFVIMAFASCIEIGPQPLRFYGDWIVDRHFPRHPLGYLYLGPSILCVIVFARAGILGVPRTLLRNPARRFLAAGVLVFASVAAFVAYVLVGLPFPESATDELQSSLFCAAGSLPSLAMLGVMAIKTKSRARQDV